MRRQKAASSDQAGVKVHLCQLTAKVKRALLRLSRQCRINHHLLMTPQPPAVTQRALLSLIAILNCSANDKSLVHWRCSVFVTAALNILIINKKCEAVIQCGCFEKTDPFNWWHVMLSWLSCAHIKFISPIYLQRC